MGWLDNVLNVNRVEQQRGTFEVSRVSAGEQQQPQAANGWEQYHNGQGPNGLKAFPDEYSGGKLNMYM